jgi:hypothetical protein
MTLGPSDELKAKARASVEAQFEQAPACFLVETTGLSATRAEVKTGYTASIENGFWERLPRVPKIGDTDQVQDVADGHVHTRWDFRVPVKAIVLYGVAVWKGLYDAGTAYAAKDGVNMGEVFYVAKAPNTNQPVTNSAYWEEAFRFKIVGTNLPTSNRARATYDLKQVNPR